MIVNRCLNALSSEIIIIGYKFSADIANFPDHYASKNFISLSTWAHMYSMLGIELRNTITVVLQPCSKKPGGLAKFVSAIQDYYFLDLLDEERMMA